MVFDPTKPVDGSPLDAVEICNQFNALKSLIDAQAAQIAALQSALNGKVNKFNMGEFDPGFSDPPTFADLRNIQTVINDMIDELNGG